MAIAFVQKTPQGDLLGGDSGTLSFGSLPAAGSLIVVGVSNWDSGSADQALAVSDNQGNTYYEAITSDESGDAVASIWYAYNIGSPTGTFTITINPAGSGDYYSACAAEFSGLTTPDPKDTTVKSAGTDTTPVCGPTATPTQADELVIAVVQVSSSDPTVGLDVPATVGYTNIEVEQDSTNIQGLSMDYKIISAAAAQSAAWGTLDASPSGGWSAVIATFKAAGGGGGGGSAAGAAHHYYQTMGVHQ
jgi:hypothetical protein